MPDNSTGMWMYHGNILEHHEAGMMANFEVIDGTKEAGQHIHHLHHDHRH